MLILAIETTGRSGSVALVRDEAVLALEAIAGGTYSAKLIPLITSLLQREGVRKQEIEGYAVASGPGSFTGLRVGLSTIKGLAEILPRPIAAVSLLEAVASVSSRPGRIHTALDAQRRQVFLGDYERAAETAVSTQAAARGMICHRESLLSEEEFVAAMRGMDNPQIVTPDAAIVALLQQHGILFEQIAAPQADVIAHLGAGKIAAGESVSPEALDANYIRRSDAEIFAKK